MSRFKIALVSFFMVASAAAGLVVTAPTTVSAATCPGGEARLLTFPAWYNGLVNDDCSMKTVGNGPDDLRNVVFRIGLNIVEIILQLVAYASVVFLLKGGFDYMMAAGDSSKVANAKKTIEHAIIGLVIALSAVTIVNLVGRAI